MTTYPDEVIDEICRRVFVGVPETPETVAMHRQSIRSGIAAVREELARGRSPAMIRKALGAASRAELAEQRVDLNSPRAETEFARAARAVDAILELIQGGEEGAAQ